MAIRSPARRIWRAAHLALRRVATLHDTPDRIARGCAAGVLCAYLPVVGQSFFGMAVAWLMRGSPLAAVPWTLITNPFTTLPLWYASYLLGSWVLHREPVVTMEGLRTTYHQLAALGAWQALVDGAAILGGMFLPMLLGSLVIGLVTAIPIGLLMRRVVVAVQARRARRVAIWQARLARSREDATT